MPDPRVMDTTRPTLALIGGRMVGAVATFAIPMVLVRVFTPDEVGTYRQLFLIFTSLYVLLQFGVPESLYYFVPRRKEPGGPFVANTVLVLGVVGAVCIALAPWAAPAVARWFDNPALLPHLPWLAVFLGLMLAAAGLEIVMVSRRRYALAAVTFAGSDALRAAALVLPPLIFGGVRAMLFGAVAFAAVRLAYQLAYLGREFGAELRLRLPSWKIQLAYALPFGAAVSVEVLQVNYHQYAVASWFDPATFAIYSLGYTQIPVVELLGTSAINVMMVAMADQAGNRDALLGLWQGTVSRLALMFVPMVALLLLVAHDLITLLYTEAYAASVPIFMVSLTFILLYTLPVDGALRVFARTRFILGMNLFRLAFIAAAIGWFVGAFGLFGAMLVTIAATAIVKLAALWRIGTLLHASPVELLPWRSLATTAAATAIALVPAYLVQAWMDLPKLFSLAIVSVVFGATCLAVLAVFRGAPMLRALMPQTERAR
jgi:O-antigen/teichoic acid export membrane protein